MLRNRKTINLSIFVFDFNVLTQLIPKSNDASVDSNKTYHNKCLIGEFLNCPVCRQSDEKVWELEQSRKCQDWYTRIGVTDAEWFVQCFFFVFSVSGLKIKVCVLRSWVDSWFLFRQFLGFWFCLETENSLNLSREFKVTKCEEINRNLSVMCIDKPKNRDHLCWCFSTQNGVYVG